MKKETVVKLAMELVWWLITALAVWIVAEPLQGKFVKPDYVYHSILNVIIFITAIRYLFLLKYTFLANSQRVKFVLIFVSVPLIFYLIQSFFGFQAFLDKEGTDLFQAHFKPELDTNQLYETIEYLTKEMVFFGMGAIFAVILFPFRLLASYWRVHNHTGTV